MRRTIAALLTVLGLCSSALAASTVNPNVPAQNANLSSAPIRNNFAAANADINNILGNYAGTSPPGNPVNLQTWADTTTSPVVIFKYYNLNTQTWVPYASLNINTNAYTPIFSSGGFAATNPLHVSVSGGGVVTYSLTYTSNFVNNGLNQLALADVASAHLIGNCTAGTAEPTDCSWNSFADRAVGTSNGMLPYRTGGAWGSISTGTTGATIPLNNTANVFSAGLTVQTAFTATGLVTLPSLATQLTNTVVANVTSGSASPTAITMPSCVGAANALQWVTDTGFACSAIVASSSSITVGSTVVASGTTTRILYDQAGVLGEYTITGSGTVVAMQTSPSLITPALGVATGTSLALGGATIGGNALAVTGTSLFNSAVTLGAGGTLTGTFAGTPTLSGANFVTLANVVQSASAWTLLGNASASSPANYAPFTIGALTNEPSPAGGDLLILQKAAGGALRNVTVSAVAGGGVVATINTLTGNIILVPTPGAARGMKIVRTSATVLTATYDQLVMATALNGIPYTEASGSHTLNTAITGVGGMDTGSPPVAGFVCVYAITKGDNSTYALLGSNAATNACSTIYPGASMPATYVASALIGIWPTASSNLSVGTQVGRHFNYQGTTAPVVVTNGTAGSLTALTTTTAWPANPGSSVIEVDVFMTQTLVSQRLVPIIASDGNGTGMQMAGFSSGGIPSNTCSGFSPLGTCYGSSTFQKVAALTSQTLYWADLSASGGNNVYVIGFWF